MKSDITAAPNTYFVSAMVTVPVKNNVAAAKFATKSFYMNFLMALEQETGALRNVIEECGHQKD